MCNYTVLLMFCLLGVSFGSNLFALWNYDRDRLDKLGCDCDKNSVQDKG